MTLKWLLVRRITLAAIVCLLAGSAVAIHLVSRDVRQRNLDLSNAIGRHLEVQLDRVDRAPAHVPRAPDWGVIESYELQQGQCVQLLSANGAVQRSRCLGFDAVSTSMPAWFLTAYSALLDSNMPVSRAITYHNAGYGTVVTEFSALATASRVWEAVIRLLGFSAVLIAVICLVTYAVIDRALRPTRDIIHGLNQLSRGELDCRLPAFRVTELNRISEVFNALSADLRKTTQDRAELALRLVDTQEQERRHLARELHDEIGQRLSALNALAACIKASAQRDAPALVDEARDLEAMASALMVSLRQTLAGLRPQIIDDLGLIQGLQTLVDQHNRIARGKTRYAIEVAQGIDALRSETSAHVYRIVQEALTNASKHANARNVLVKLERVPGSGGDEIRLAVSDDGMGAAEQAPHTKGSGIIGMRERVAALSGKFDAGPQSDGGFMLQVAFPTLNEARP